LAEPPSLHLGVALDGAGWHPAAWREDDAAPGPSLFSAGYWVDLAARAEAALLDFITIEDSLTVQSDRARQADERTDRVLGRLDAVQVAARVAPTTSRIGLIPTVRVTHTEPCHTSKAIATLDYVSRGRAGMRAQISMRSDEARHFGRRSMPDTGPVDPDLPGPVDPDLPGPVDPDLPGPVDPELQKLVADVLEEAGDYIEVVRRLWDSWEDEAEIRDVATGRFVDRDKLHYIDFSGRWFSVRGPSITPRPPQGQPLVAALGHGSGAFRLIANAADLGFVTPRDSAHALELVEGLRRHQIESGSGAPGVSVMADIVVYLDQSATAAAARKTRLDERAGAEWESDATTFAGTALELADLMEDWAGAGLGGFRLRPAALPHDLDQIAARLVPELQRRGLFRRSYEASTLRGLFGLDRPPNRYAVA
jgi:alkanesulfonate monooxygenase SsuD/methylene tetrahydromethanopterin reductase-like flavin-dependent oxidoreductase (luciferase family)